MYPETIRATKNTSQQKHVHGNSQNHQEHITTKSIHIETEPSNKNTSKQAHVHGNSWRHQEHIIAK